jgi:hypothetical protein
MEYAKKENTNPAPGELRPQCESERRADQTGPATLCDVLPPGSVKADHSVALLPVVLLSWLYLGSIVRL